MGKKILLVNTNRHRLMTPLPVGLAFLAESLHRQGHEVKVTDLMFSKEPHKELWQTLRDFRPDFAGFTIRNLDNQDMESSFSPLPEIKAFIQAAKDQNIPTIVGGTAFTTFPKKLLEYMDADYGIAGQGEDGFPRLIESLSNGQLDTKIPGLVWREKKKIMSNPVEYQGYRNTPADFSVLSMAGYRKSLMPASVLTKTGCPYKCSYCDAHVTFGREFIFREPDSIIEDIRRFRRLHRVATFFLVDPCFNAPIDRAKELLEAIIQAELGVNINTMFVPIRDNFDDELFRMYRKAGGNFMMVGAETLSDTMLKSYQKPFDMSDVFSFTEMAKRNGVTFGIDAMFGGPGETEQTVKETFEAYKEIPCSFLMGGVGIRIVPQCSLYDTAKDEGLVESEDELLFPKFYLTKQITRQEIEKIVRQETRRYSYRMMKMLPVGARSFAARYLNVAF